MPTRTLILSTAIACCFATGASATDATDAAETSLGFDPAAIEPIALGFTQDEDAAPLVTELAKPEFGAAGTSRWRIYGGGGNELNTGAESMRMAGASLSHFIADGISLDLQLNYVHFEQQQGDADAVNLALLFSWHFIRETNWSLYVYAGAGAMYSTQEVPFEGSQFNFTPQAGVGATFEVANDTRLFVNGGWHHVSNANLYSMNSGRDGWYIYGGVSFGF